MEKNITKFLNPKSIAVVGASNTQGKVGYILMEKLQKFKGNVIPVNIREKAIFGKKAYKSVLEIPKKVDLVIIATPNFTVKDILEDCGKKGIKNVIVISAGFAEVKNYRMQEEIINTIKKYKINILGPNCFGVANPYLNLDATFSNTSSKKGKIAFIAQSGALWSYLSDFPNIKFSGYISLGNMADLDFVDFIKYFDKDKNTKKIVLYIEKLKNGREFIQVCKKSKKQIIAVKAGSSKRGSKMAVSHTASLATDYSVYKGAFKQAGVKLVDSLAKAVGLKQEQIITKIKKTDKVIIITNAGGAGTLLTDYFENKNINVIKVTDLLGTATARAYKKELSKKIYKKIDKIIVILTPQKMSEPEKVAKEIIKSKYRKKIIACFLGNKSVKEAVKKLRTSDVPVFTQCC